MSLITASAPGKLLLFGDHAVVYGHPCISTAVDQRLYVEVEILEDPKLHLAAPDVGLQAYVKSHTQLGTQEVPKAVAFIEHLYKRFLAQYPQTTGVKIKTYSDFSSLFGFGSSSAVTVALAFALSELYELKLDKKSLFDLCYRAVLDVQGVGSGFDLATAIWGGTIYYKRGAAVVEDLNIPSLPLVVAYTGIKADTPTLVRMVEREYQQRETEIKTIFESLGSAAEKAKAALMAEAWETVGGLMNQSHAALQSLQVSSQILDTLTEAAISAGALGAKLSGAGGGDCMIALTLPESESQIKEALVSKGGTVMNVTLQAEGVRREKSL